MARGREPGHGDASGTSEGADLEPLRGGMKEIDRGRLGPEHAGAGHREEERAGLERAPRAEPAAPYHATSIPEGGLAPRAEPGEGSTPAPSRGEIEATAGAQVAKERLDHENEAANAPRGGATSASRGAPDRRGRS